MRTIQYLQCYTATTDRRGRKCAMKKPTHSTALIAGTERNATALPAGFFVDPRRRRMSAPRPAASTAKRVCSQGSSASAAPCSRHGFTAARVGRGFRVCAQQRPEPGQYEHATRTVRIDHEALENRRDWQRHRGPREPGSVGAPGRQPGAVPRERGACGGEHDQEQHDRAVAAEGECGCDERRQPRSVHRVDAPVLAAQLHVRLQLAAVVGAVVAAPVHFSMVSERSISRLCVMIR